MSTFVPFHCSLECLEAKTAVGKGNKGETQVGHFVLVISPDKMVRGKYA